MIDATVSFVKKTLAGAEGGHDWFHIERVWKNALTIAEKEGGDLLVIQLAALLHDIADSKFHGGDETVGPWLAADFMQSQDVPEPVRQHVIKIIENISFKGGYAHSDFTSVELYVVRDADRLDAMGAIGIARAFNFGGFKGRPLYDPGIPPQVGMSKEEYKKAHGPTINHFYEKLLLLKDLMHTETGKKMAGERHAFMVSFLDRFYKEWKGL